MARASFETLNEASKIVENLEGAYLVQFSFASVRVQWY